MSAVINCKWPPVSSDVEDGLVDDYREIDIEPKLFGYREEMRPHDADLGGPVGKCVV